MKKFEYKHTRMFYDRFISQERFDTQLMETLDEMGKDGWELRTMFHEGFFHEGISKSHVHLIFGREITTK
jgi:hypothetical protein